VTSNDLLILPHPENGFSFDFDVNVHTGSVTHATRNKGGLDAFPKRARNPHSQFSPNPGTKKKQNSLTYIIVLATLFETLVASP